MPAASRIAGRSGKRPGTSTRSDGLPSNKLVCLDIVSTESKWSFDWDPAKSASNEAKHGLSLAAATALWGARWQLWSRNGPAKRGISPSA